MWDFWIFLKCFKLLCLKNYYVWKYVKENRKVIVKICRKLFLFIICNFNNIWNMKLLVINNEVILIYWNILRIIYFLKKKKKYKEKIFVN